MGGAASAGFLDEARRLVATRQRLSAIHVDELRAFESLGQIRPTTVVRALDVGGLGEWTPQGILAVKNVQAMCALAEHFSTAAYFENGFLAPQPDGYCEFVFHVQDEGDFVEIRASLDDMIKQRGAPPPSRLRNFFATDQRLALLDKLVDDPVAAVEAALAIEDVAELTAVADLLHSLQEYSFEVRARLIIVDLHDAAHGDSAVVADAIDAVAQCYFAMQNVDLATKTFDRAASMRRSLANLPSLSIGTDRSFPDTASDDGEASPKLSRGTTSGIIDSHDRPPELQSTRSDTQPMLERRRSFTKERRNLP